MKILQINFSYRKGSTGKITADIHEELQKQGIESIVCYGRGAKILEPYVYKVSNEIYSKFYNLYSRFTGIKYGGLLYSTSRLIKIIKKENPDVVHLQCINGFFVNIYRLVRFLKEQHIRTVLTLHAEFMYTANCGIAVDCEKWKTGCGNCPRLKKETQSLLLDGTHRSWKLMKDAFDGFGSNLIVVSVSSWLKDRAKQSPILSSFRHSLVYNGLDTRIFKHYSNHEVLDHYGIDSSKQFVFYAAPSFSLELPSIKGGYYVCELAKSMPEVTFVIAAPYKSGIHVPKNVKLLGKIENQEDLAQLYSAASATILTSSRETFSMVTAESLCCGTPVVGFKAGGPESIAIPSYSFFVDYGNVNELKRVLTFVLRQKWNALEISNESHSHYARETMTKEYIKIYKKLIDSN